jgi:hypothetical protein
MAAPNGIQMMIHEEPVAKKTRKPRTVPVAPKPLLPNSVLMTLVPPPASHVGVKTQAVNRLRVQQHMEGQLDSDVEPVAALYVMRMSEALVHFMLDCTNQLLAENPTMTEPAVVNELTRAQQWFKKLGIHAFSGGD